MARLDEALETIIEGILAAIQDAVDDSDGVLAEKGVAAVVRGPKARPMPALPSIWIVAQNATMTNLTYQNETWELPISIACLVKNEDPAAGGAISLQITALARSAALQAENIAADITDIVSVSFDPTAHTEERNRTLHWTEAVISVTFTVTE